MKKIFTAISLLFLCISQTFAITTEQKKDITKSLTNDCKDIKESDIPTIFIPGIAASWYSQEGFGQTKVKRWIPDPISHAYDTLFYTFKQNGYSIKDVFYDDEFTLRIEGNPKGGLYLFGYDWKKDNRITATLLTQLIGLIYRKYEEENHGCKLIKVNIIAHSMGGLVARSMLEDMCLEFKSKGSYFDFDAFPSKNDTTNSTVDGKIKDFKDYIINCTNPINPSQPIRVNKLITISTPQRGSPKALPLWEKGDLEITDGIGFELAMKMQLIGVFKTDTGLYQAIHGYDDRIPNGIVGLGQLLPDVSKETEYNRSLRYLYTTYPWESELSNSKNGNFNLTISNPYPKNSFLEELNSQKRINTLFSKVSKFISYYSTITGNDGKNNIVKLGVSKEYATLYNGYKYETRLIHDDKTSEFVGRDIYEYYPSKPTTNIYSISEAEILRDESGLGGDGTVPTKNLMLVANDSKDGIGVIDAKFEARKITCNDPRYNLYSIGSDSQLYRRLGEENRYQICSHTNMPKAVATKVIDDIAGTNVKSQERNKLLSYLGHTKYQNERIIKVPDCNNIEILTNTCNRYDEYTIAEGLNNTDKLDNYFEEKNYIHAVSENEIENDRKYTNQLSIDFSTNTNIFRYDILSPINVLITDEQGRRIGIDPDTGKIINEIPGAWTSGDTAGSNEPEFFLIPDTLSGKLTHKIETFGTGDGVYHIEMREIAMNSTGGQENNGITKLLTIAGNTKEGFGQEYKVTETQTGTTQENPTFLFTNISDYPAKVETQLDTYVTLQDTFTLRYSVKGDGKNVAKIQVETTDSKGTKTTNSYTINGEIPLTLKEIGSTKVTFTLLDKGGKALTYDGAKKVVTIKRIENIAKQSLTISGATLNQEALDLYEKNKAKRSLFDFSSFFK